MSFWENVDLELNYSGKTRKELACDAGIDVSTIAKGLKSHSIPAADVALKIAKFLNVSVEYLLTGNDTFTTKTNADGNYNFRKYRTLLENLETLSPKNQNLVSEMVSALKG